MTFLPCFLHTPNFVKIHSSHHQLHHEIVPPSLELVASSKSHSVAAKPPSATTSFEQRYTKTSWRSQGRKQFSPCQQSRKKTLPVNESANQAKSSNLNRWLSEKPRDESWNGMARFSGSRKDNKSSSMTCRL